MVHPDYKSAKQAFVADNPGDAVTRINAVCWTAIVSGCWPCIETGVAPVPETCVRLAGFISAMESSAAAPTSITSAWFQADGRRIRDSVPSASIGPDSAIRQTHPSERPSVCHLTALRTVTNTLQRIRSSCEGLCSLPARAISTA